LVHPGNSFAFHVIAGDKTVFDLGATGWGPNWSWFGISSNAKGTGDSFKIGSPIDIGGQRANLGLTVRSLGANGAVFEYSLQAERDIPLTQIVATISMQAGEKGLAVLTRTDGSTMDMNLPVPNPTDGGVVKTIRLTGPAFPKGVELKLEPPLAVSAHGDLRIRLAADTLKAGQTAAKITYTFPAESELLLSEREVMKYAPVLPGPDWFEYRPTGDTGPSAIGTEEWFEKPAGKRGRVRMKGDQFVLADGTPIRFWGTNLSYALSAPLKDDAIYTAARFAKYGTNAVRMHKFTGPGWEGIGDEQVSTKMKPDGLDRLDFFSSELTKNGVYYGWSHTYHFKIRPGDRPRVSGFDELMKKGGDTYGIINWAEDVQDLLIESVVELLKHKNPYTGKTYASDPALAFIELHNEDDIFFWTSGPAYDDFPTYRKQLDARFAKWLQAKYGSQAKLATAWGKALREGERIASANLKVEANPWGMTDAGLPREKGGQRTRMLDNAAFLHEVQNAFYSKFVKAIRDTGYQGPLIGSPWQAPGMLPHYYNLLSDDEVGYIDRHNYFGEALNETLLKTPGGGYLSSGLQQVAGKPFGVSEWIHVYPCLNTAEGPVLMAAYGMGLQGWGASYEFQSTSARINWGNTIVGNQPFGVWNADVPTQIGQYPILARMIHRGDVTTGPVISTRQVSPKNLATGEFDFSDTIQQQGDVKAFTGTVPAESLAAGRVLVEFVKDKPRSTFPDMNKYMQGTAIVSATQQLKWDTADGGFATIDTPGTQGYVGFAAGKSLAFGDITIKAATKYASILVTAESPKGLLSKDQRVLISAVARNSNKGFRILTLDGKTIVDNGTAPIMLEPVQAELSFSKRKVKQVNVLDQDGKRTNRTVPVKNGAFTIDTGRDMTLYYEVVCE
jgi:hypothetical protein